MENDEAFAIEQMIDQVSRRMVCQDFDEGGNTEFFGAVSSMLHQRPEGHLALVARVDKRPVGYIHIRDGNHICLFFVNLSYQGQGIGRLLFEEAVRQCYPHGSAYFEVNSSLFAVPIYEALGFQRQSGVRLVNGIRFVELTFGRFDQTPAHK